jgi:uncharacterized protein (TIGR03067 family)
MRACAFVAMVVAILLTAEAGTPRAGAGTGTQSERIARLIQQLGDDDFAQRDAASKELDAIGEPAVAALRQVAASSADAEIRRRAEIIVRNVLARALAIAAKKELAKWEGSWIGDPGVTLTITGDRFTSAAPRIGPRNGKLVVIEIREKVVLVDFFVDEGDVRGQTAKAILRLEGDTLHYCVTYSESRPADFKTAAGNYYVAWKRTRK